MPTERVHVQLRLLGHGRHPFSAVSISPSNTSAQSERYVGSPPADHWNALSRHPGLWKSSIASKIPAHTGCTSQVTLVRHSLCHIPALRVFLIIQNHLVFSKVTIFFGDRAWQMPLSVLRISVYISHSVNLPLICHLWYSLSFVKAKSWVELVLPPVCPHTTLGFPGASTIAPTPA